MPLPATARRSHEGGVHEPPDWAVPEGIFDALFGPGRRDFAEPGAGGGNWEDATGVEHRAETLSEIEAAYRSGRAVRLIFGGTRSDGAFLFFAYSLTDGRAFARVEGRPDEVDALIKPVAEAFPLQRRVIFISWSGDRARRVAEALRAILLPRMPPGGEVFLSTRIAPRAQPLSEILDTLSITDVHMAVLTPESSTSHWVTWEAAASWGRGKPVIPLLVDVGAGDVATPLRLVAQGVRLDAVEEAVRRVLADVGGREDDLNPDDLQSLRES